MAPLKGIAVGAALFSSMPAVARTAAPDLVARWQPYIAEASQRFGVPEVWIAAIMRAESAGRTIWRDRQITSRAGAMGLMQLMPMTWGEMRQQLGLGIDPYDPRNNILAGSFYLRRMYDRFGYPGMFAAYNAGPARYAFHLTSGRALPGETRAYLVTLSRSSSMPAVPSMIVSGERLFFTRRAGNDSSGRDTNGNDLFADCLHRAFCSSETVPLRSR